MNLASAGSGGFVRVPDWLLFCHQAPVLLDWHLLVQELVGEDGGPIVWHADNFSRLIGEPTNHEVFKKED